MQKIKFNPSMAGIIFLILLWQVIAMLVGIPELFPSFTDLLLKLITFLINPEFYSSLAMTLLRGLTGFAAALVLAGFFSVIALLHPFWKSFLQPVMVTIRSVPVISVVLIALLLLSPPQLPVFIALITMFPILYQNFLSGMEHTDVRLIEMSVVFRKNLKDRFRYIYLPSARKMIYAGISTALGFGWRAVIIGEVLAGPVHGLGTGMKKAQAYIDMPGILAWTVVAILVSLCFEFLVKIMERNVVSAKLNYKSHITKEISLKTENKSFRISNLNLKFNQKIIFNHFSHEFHNDHFYLLRSVSGSGKTSLLKIIAGLLKPESGVVEIPDYFRISYAFQDLRLIPWLSVEENIAFVAPGFPHPDVHYQERIKKLIVLLELTGHGRKLPEALSGGQQQRVALARALCCDAEILLLDEPLNGLDKSLKQKIIKVIENQIEGIKPIVLWATHEAVEESLTGSAIKLDFTPDISTFPG